MASTPVMASRTDDRRFDAPVGNPDKDLLGTAPYASALAELIRAIAPPYTIGIYGEWGTGKTSFVRFVRHYLEQNPAGRDAEPVRFIHFMAWPYRTSDELWRALILKIARGLYNVPDDSPALADTHTMADAVEGAPAHRGRLLTDVIDRLSADALVLRAPPPKQDASAEYKTLLARLDATLYGGIDKGRDDAPRLDHERILIAAVRAAVAGLGFLSPLVAALRGLFKLEDKIDPADLLAREKNQATRKRIESMDEFRAEMRSLFERRACGMRVCVFVDDLDRCMPDTALDVLEAIKIFLGDVRCVFIVAADEQLIGQGLRLRYRDLLEAGGQQEVQELLTRKGREYFEKIIQLHIPLPPTTSEQTHKFLVAQFPRWLAATDIISVAVGDNPRRLKQYCERLLYSYAVKDVQRNARTR
jgi:hypothetical protein